MQKNRFGHGRLAAEAAAGASLPAGVAPHPEVAALSRVLVHGFAGTQAAFDPLLGALAEQGGAAPQRTLALPGHHAPLPPPPHHFAGAVDQLVAQLPTGACHLIGYSMGARLALGVALAVPTKIRLLTLVGVHPGLEHDAERAARRQADGRWQRCLRNDGLVAFVRLWQAQPLFASQAHLPPAVLQAQQQQRYSLHAEALAAALDCLGLGAMPNYWPRLRRLPMPVLSVCGGLDRKFLRLQARLVRSLPCGFAHQVPQVGHNVVLEAPVQLAHLIRDHELRYGLGSHDAAPGEPETTRVGALPAFNVFTDRLP